MVLAAEEFDQSYFDGESARMRHNAGYNRYERWYRYEGQDSMGEFWNDFAKMLVGDFDLVGLDVLELGCAKGFVVEDLRRLGVNAFGCDVSRYAISKASEFIGTFLQCGDALAVLKKLSTEKYDFIISRGFLESIDPVVMPLLVSEMNRVAKRQAHFIHTHINPEFYIRQSLDDWARYRWKSGTVLISVEGSVEHVV